MKKLKKVILISIILLYVLSIKTFADTGKVNIEATRIRKENNTTSEILTVIYEDDEVEILETKGEWLKIKYKEHTGYVMKRYIDISDSTSSSKNTTLNDTTKNTTSKNETKNTTSKNETKNATSKNETKNTTTNQDQVSVYDNDSNTNLDKNSSVKLKTDVQLRLQPSIMSKKTVELTAGIDLTIEEKMGKWIQVTDGTVIGWVLDNKVSAEENAQNVNTSDIDDDKDKQNTTNTTNNKTNTTNTNTSGNTTNTTSNKVANQTTTNTTSSASSVSKKGTINVETAKVRKEPSTSAALVDFLDYGDEVSISKESGDWYYVKHQNIEGFVNKRLITLTGEDVSSRSLTDERKENENAEETTKSTENTLATGNQIAEYAKKFLGTSYVVGGKTPETGFDCSGFTRYVYKNFGYSLSTTSSGQSSAGTEISRESIMPGDLIIFYNEEKTKVGHTGVYIGNGDFVHSANPERGVVIDNLNTNSYYNERYISARRIAE